MIGLVLIVIGAILLWAVTATVNGVDLNTVGAILLIAGIVELLVELLVFRSFRRLF